MIRLTLITLALFINTVCWCRINPDSLTGTYTFKKSMGGGFTGGPNGECMATPPDYRVTHKLNILPDLLVSKTSDTAWYSISTGIHLAGCDTLAIGKAKLTGDTLVVSYTLKPICTGFFYDKQAGKKKRYEKLKQPMTEKFIIIRDANGRVDGLRTWDDEGEVYEKEQAYEAKQ